MCRLLHYRKGNVKQLSLIHIYSQAGLVGMNVLKSGMLAAVAGTTTPVMRVTARYEIDEFAFTNRHGVPGLWLQEGNA